MVLFIVADDAHQSPVRAIDAQHVSIGEVRPGKGHRPPLKEKITLLGRAVGPPYIVNGHVGRKDIRCWILFQHLQGRCFFNGKQTGPGSDEIGHAGTGPKGRPQIADEGSDIGSLRAGYGKGTAPAVEGQKFQTVDCHLPHRQGEIPVLAGQFIGLDAVDVDGRILRRRLIDIAAERGQDAADICFGKIRNRQPFDDRPRTVFGIGCQPQDEFGMV